MAELLLPMLILLCKKMLDTKLSSWARVWRQKCASLFCLSITPTRSSTAELNFRKDSTCKCQFQCQAIFLMQMNLHVKEQMNAKRGNVTAESAPYRKQPEAGRKQIEVLRFTIQNRSCNSWMNYRLPRKQSKLPPYRKVPQFACH